MLNNNISLMQTTYLCSHINSSACGFVHWSGQPGHQAIWTVVLHMLYAFYYPVLNTCLTNQFSLFPCFIRLAHPAHQRKLLGTIVPSDRLFSGQWADESQVNKSHDLSTNRLGLFGSLYHPDHSTAYMELEFSFLILYRFCYLFSKKLSVIYYDRV